MSRPIAWNNGRDDARDDAANMTAREWWDYLADPVSYWRDIAPAYLDGEDREQWGEGYSAELDRLARHRGRA